MTEYEMVINTIRDTIRDVRLAARECYDCGTPPHTADRLRNHAAGLCEALLIVEKIHKQFS